jgi:phosphoglycerate kinase
LLLAKEIESLNRVLNNSVKPVTAVLGGSKVSSKITVIENILDKVDHMIIGGGLTFTFIKALGGKIGDSICEDDKQELALEILNLAKLKNVHIHIPIDVVAADSFSNDANTQIVDVREILDGWQGLDAGPKSLANFREVIMNSKTILWNGPLGVFEMENFANGTIELGNYIAESTANGAFSLVGGGDSVAAVKQFGLEEKMSYVSTGGGAMLEMLEGRVLPGIAAILS